MDRVGLSLIVNEWQPLVGALIAGLTIQSLPAAHGVPDRLQAHHHGTRLPASSGDLGIDPDTAMRDPPFMQTIDHLVR